MTPIAWLLWAGLSVVAVALSVVHYRRRETAGRGRMLLAGLRGATLALLFLLLFNPELPAGGASARAGTQVLLDASLSMMLPATGGESRWEQAVAAARAHRTDRPVLLFGDRVRAVARDALPVAPPGDARTLLMPGVRAAAEAGARRVVIITDGGLEDAAEVGRWAARLGIELVLEPVGAPLANRALTEVSAPAWVEAGAPFTVEFAIAAPATDSLRVVVRRDGRVLGRAAVPAPAAGRLATGSIEVRVDGQASPAPVALEVALEGEDPVPDDDVRTVYVHVSDAPAGIALISLRPDWEPRFLAPVLGQALGLPVHAFLAGPADGWVRLAGGLDAGVSAAEAEVWRAVDRAELVVLHGVDADAPDWVAAALRGASRLLVFPADGAELPLPVRTGAPQPGDWFPVTVPASPVAGLLAGQALSAAAPLTSLLPADAPADAWAPLLASRGRRGAPAPVVLAGADGSRRWAVALGTGYWQWAFRGGDERELYTRLWGAVGGWLARERRTAGLPAVRPVEPAVPRGLPIPWLAAGVAADSFSVRLDAGPDVVADTVVVPVRGDTAFTASPAPGSYRYRATAWAGDTVLEASGPLTVERYSPEFARRLVDPGMLQTGAVPVRGGDDAAVRRGGTALHATAWPWLVLVLLLAAEWILRRRWGLR